MSQNRTRLMLTDFFRERNCATLVRPVESEEDLQRLDALPYEALREVRGRERGCVCVYVCVCCHLFTLLLFLIPNTANLSLKVFRDQLEMLGGNLFSQSQPKEIHGKRVTGLMLEALVRSYVTAVNDGGVPCIADACEWISVWIIVCVWVGNCVSATKRGIVVPCSFSMLL